MDFDDADFLRRLFGISPGSVRDAKDEMEQAAADMFEDMNPDKAGEVNLAYENLLGALRNRIDRSDQAWVTENLSAENMDLVETLASVTLSRISSHLVNQMPPMQELRALIVVSFVLAKPLMAEAIYDVFDTGLVVGAEMMSEK